MFAKAQYVTVCFQEKYEENLSQREAEKLNEMVSKLSDEDKAMIREKGHS